jgi:transcription factor E
VQEIGEYVIHVIKNFDGYISDEDLAKKCQIKPSEVRVVLNRLHAKGFAEYIRKKDKKNGWYSYIWYLKPAAAQKFYEGFKKIKQEASAPPQTEQELYYAEVDGKIKYYTFEQAFENKFICPETGKPLKYLNRNK